ncbi:MAG: hypothetical protein HC865_23730 [Cyanobacteria bacterium RU_5_0]|nr:hypothetical protein [Cyanobacteria bacterium RU_5_0]
MYTDLGWDAKVLQDSPKSPLNLARTSAYDQPVNSAKRSPLLIPFSFTFSNDQR